MLISDLRSS